MMRQSQQQQVLLVVMIAVRLMQPAVQLLASAAGVQH
jgi:hypothetical protein